MGGWNVELYRSRARHWREQAEGHPPGNERDGCLEIALGYERLLAAIGELPVASQPDDFETRQVP